MDLSVVGLSGQRQGFITSVSFHPCQQIRTALTRFHPYQQGRFQVFMYHAIASHEEVVVSHETVGRYCVSPQSSFY
jgi:hypothetical protein